MSCISGDEGGVVRQDDTSDEDIGVLEGCPGCTQSLVNLNGTIQRTYI